MRLCFGRLVVKKISPKIKKNPIYSLKNNL